MTLENEDEEIGRAQDQAKAQEEAASEASHAAATAEMAAPIQAGRILGIDRRYYPMQDILCLNDHCVHQGGQCGDPPVTLAVLVAGDIGDYACYVGHGTPEWVARYGNKIGFEEACCHFPGGQLKRERYRI